MPEPVGRLTDDPENAPICNTPTSAAEQVQKLTEENERLEWLLSQWETWAHRGRPVLCRCGTWTLDGRDGNETVHECAPSYKGEQ